MRGLFKVAALLTTAGILASGSPQRVAGHLIRKGAHRQLARALRSTVRRRPRRRRGVGAT